MADFVVIGGFPSERILFLFCFVFFTVKKDSVKAQSVMLPYCNVSPSLKVKSTKKKERKEKKLLNSIDIANQIKVTVSEGSLVA